MVILEGRVSMGFLDQRVVGLFSTMKLLTCRTMAVFRIQRLLSAQLILDLATMAAGFIAGVKVWVVVMDLVGCSKLPLIVFAVSAPVVAIVAVGTVCRCVFGHDPSTGLELKFVDAKERSGCWTEFVRCEIEASRF